MAGALCATLACANLGAQLFLKPGRHAPAWWEWIGIWIGLTVTVALLFWLVLFIPSPRRIALSKRGLSAGKRWFKYESLRGFSWRPHGDQALFGLMGADGLIAEYGAPPEMAGEVREFLTQRGLLEVPFVAPQKAVDGRGEQVWPIGVFVVWSFLLPLAVFPLAIGLSKVKARIATQDFAWSTAALAVRQKLSPLGRPREEIRAASDVLVRRSAWPYAEWPLTGCATGLLALWYATGFAAMEWSKRRRSGAGDQVSARELQIGLGTGLVCILLIGTCAIAEQQWEADISRARISEFERRLRTLAVEPKVRGEIDSLLTTLPIPPEFFGPRITIVASGTTWPVAIAVAFAGVRMQRLNRRQTMPEP